MLPVSGTGWIPLYKGGKVIGSYRKTPKQQLENGSSIPMDFFIDKEFLAEINQTDFLFSSEKKRRIAIEKVKVVEKL